MCVLSIGSAYGQDLSSGSVVVEAHALHVARHSCRFVPTEPGQLTLEWDNTHSYFMKTVLVRLLVKKPDEPVGVDAAVEAMAEAAADMGGLFRGASATPQVDTKCMAYVELHVCTPHTVHSRRRCICDAARV